MFLFALSGQSPTPPSLSLGGRDSLHLSPSLSLVKEVERTVNADEALAVRVLAHAESSRLSLVSVCANPVTCHVARQRAGGILLRQRFWKTIDFHCVVMWWFEGGGVLREGMLLEFYLKHC